MHVYLTLRKYCKKKIKVDTYTCMSHEKPEFWLHVELEVLIMALLIKIRISQNNSM